jgi:ubiquinone/menaquinone biosynthesis C-methylase UbiE
MTADETIRSGKTTDAGKTPVRGLCFGSAAEAYERYRAGYPDELADLVISKSTSPPTTAVEIGAGTGKATRLFAGRGISVTAVEPDPEMCSVLSQVTTGLPVSIVQSTLETLPEQVANSPVNLLYAATAWHWTEPTTRWVRAARVVAEGGVFASFGGPTDIVDPAIAAAVRRVRTDVLTMDDVPEPWVRPEVIDFQWPGSELVNSPYFTDVTQDDLTSTHSMRADDFVGLLGTVSAYTVLTEGLRADVLHRIRGVLPDTFEVRRDLFVHQAIRTDVRAAVE